MNIEYDLLSEFSNRLVARPVLNQLAVTFAIMFIVIEILISVILPFELSPGAVILESLALSLAVVLTTNLHYLTNAEDESNFTENWSAFGRYHVSRLSIKVTNEVRPSFKKIAHEIMMSKARRHFAGPGVALLLSIVNTFLLTNGSKVWIALLILSLAFTVGLYITARQLSKTAHVIINT